MKMLVLILALLFPLAVFADSNNDLIKASEKGDKAAVVSLLAGGANVNAKDGTGLTPVMWASFKGHTDIVKFLIEKAPM